MCMRYWVFSELITLCRLCCVFLCCGRRKSEWGRWCARGKRQMREQQRVRHVQHQMTELCSVAQRWHCNPCNLSVLALSQARPVRSPRVWTNCTGQMCIVSGCLVYKWRPTDPRRRHWLNQFWSCNLNWFKIVFQVQVSNLNGPRFFVSLRKRSRAKRGFKIGPERNHGKDKRGQGNKVHGEGGGTVWKVQRWLWKTGLWRYTGKKKWKWLGATKLGPLWIGPVVFLEWWKLQLKK